MSGFGVVMLGFVFFGLVPLYGFICEITGLNGKTGRIDSQAIEASAVDTERWVTIEFTGNSMDGLPWTFGPEQRSLRVHPGKATDTAYYAYNKANEIIVGQAVPSVTPSRAAEYFKKIECFCFTQQTLSPGQRVSMPLQFVVDPKLPKDIKTITLSYAFFNTDKRARGKLIGAQTIVPHDHAQDG